MRKEMMTALMSLCLVAPIDRSVAADEPPTSQPTQADKDAFIVAARHGRMAEIRALLAKGIKPDEPRDHNGNLALGLAALEGQIEAVKLLIESGADPKNDILKYCSYQDDVVVATYLIEKGAGQKKSELIAHEVPLVFYTEKPAFRKLLIEKTATDPNQRHGGQTLLINSIKMGMTEVVKVLLEKGADPAATADNGDTPQAVAQRSHAKLPEMTKLIETALAARKAAAPGQPPATPTPTTAASPAPTPTVPNRH